MLVHSGQEAASILVRRRCQSKASDLPIHDVFYDLCALTTLKGSQELLAAYGAQAVDLGQYDSGGWR